MRIRIALTTAAAVLSTIMFAITAPVPTGAAVIRGVPSVSGFDALFFTPPTTTVPAPSRAAAHWASLLAASAKAPPPPPPPAPPTDATSTDTADWQCIRVEESGDSYNDPNKPSGAYGILEMTWRSNGFNGWPYEAAPALQDALALKLYNEFGWAPWSSRFACGL